MTNGWFQIVFFLALVFAVTKPLGIFMARVFNRESTFMDPVLRPVERLLYRVTGVDEDHEMRWTEYAVSMLLFSLVTMLLLYLIERMQGFLPFNPQKLGAVDITPASAAFQLPRVAKARGINEEELGRIVAASTKGRQLGFLGEPRVNVLELNLELDRQFPGSETRLREP